MEHAGRGSVHPLLISLALTLSLRLVVGPPHLAMAQGGFDVETPTPDPLAPPVMPEAPTQVDVGRNLYYYHCMPCHGDQGQGLTDAWRQVWVEDHQDCWARGCHGGRESDQGFPIPRSVPAVSGSAQAIAHFETAESLFGFLQQAHPPQRPGALAEEECWALTAFLLYKNNRLASDGYVGPGARKRPGLEAGILATITFGVLFAALFFFRRSAGHPAVNHLMGP